MRSPFHLLAGLAVTAVLLLLPTTAGAAVPPGFVGMNADSVFSLNVSPERQLDTMVASGVESIRVVFNWSAAQPYPDWNHVPLDQVSDYLPYHVPTSFAQTDRIVEAAARRGLTVLPVVIYTPSWDVAPNTFTALTLGVPRRAAPYASYLRLLVMRYGPRGSFWSSHRDVPKIPIRSWQIWNEPDIHSFWSVSPSWAPSYVRLLRSAHAAIKRADRGAKVVLAGLSNYVWTDLAKVYAAGGRKLFDVVAVHPYTKVPSGVIRILQLVRDVMDRAGDRGKPMILTELGWPSALGKVSLRADFETNEAGQARKLAEVLPLLAQVRRQLELTGFYYYTWITQEVKDGSDAFAFAGLLRFDNGRVTAKAAYRAFRRGALKLEACRKKAAVATRCARPG